MEQWLSAAEIAALGLPGVPRSKQGVIARAKTHGWISRRRKKVGGGFEYHVSGLPLAAIMELVCRETEARGGLKCKFRGGR